MSSRKRWGRSEPRFERKGSRRESCLLWNVCVCFRAGGGRDEFVGDERGGRGQATTANSQRVYISPTELSSSAHTVLSLIKFPIYIPQLPLLIPRASLGNTRQIHDSLSISPHTRRAIPRVGFGVEVSTMGQYFLSIFPRIVILIL